MTTPTNRDNIRDNIIGNLKRVDTLHDFWSKGRGEDIQDILNVMYKDNVKQDVTTFANQAVSAGALTEIEVRGEKEFEKKEKLDLPSLKESETFGKVHYTLTKMPTNEEDATKLSKYFDEHPQIQAITIKRPSKEDKKNFFKENSLNFIAGVILKFFGRKNDETVVFPIDAKAGDLPCIFQDIKKNVFTLATALTVGDSAGGGVNEIKNKSEDKQVCNKPSTNIQFNKKFEQPLPFPFNNVDKKRQYDITSNIFTKDVFELYYTENKMPFSVKNQSSIILHVLHLHSPKKTWSAPFELNASSTSVSGVSVVTLRDLIRIINRTQSDTAKMAQEITDFKNNKGFYGQLDLSPIILGMISSGITYKTIIQFLLDYKRAGDYEQVNSTLVVKNQTGTFPIFCTGDRLCSVYARVQELNCVFTHADSMDLYRFQTAPLSAAESADRLNLRLTGEVVKSRDDLVEQQLKKMKKVIEIPNFEDDLEKYLTYIKRWITEYKDAPLIVIILVGLEAKIETYLGNFEQYTTEIAKIFFAKPNYPSSPIKDLITNITNESIDTNNYENFKSRISEINTKFEYFFKNITTMSSMGAFALDKNLLGPEPSTGQGDSGSSDQIKSELIGAKYKNAPFFSTSIKKAILANKLLKDINEYILSRERIKKWKLQQHFNADVLEKFKTTVNSILDSYIANETILEQLSEPIRKNISVVKDAINTLSIDSLNDIVFKGDKVSKTSPQGTNLKESLDKEFKIIYEPNTQGGGGGPRKTSKVDLRGEGTRRDNKILAWTQSQTRERAKITAKRRQNNQIIQDGDADMDTASDADIEQDDDDDDDDADMDTASDADIEQDDDDDDDDDDGDAVEGNTVPPATDDEIAQLNLNMIIACSDITLPFIESLFSNLNPLMYLKFLIELYKLLTPPTNQFSVPPTLKSPGIIQPQELQLANIVYFITSIKELSSSNAIAVSEDVSSTPMDAGAPPSSGLMDVEPSDAPAATATSAPATVPAASAPAAPAAPAASAPATVPAAPAAPAATAPAPLAAAPATSTIPPEIPIDDLVIKFINDKAPEIVDANSIKNLSKSLTTFIKTNNIAKKYSTITFIDKAITYVKIDSIDLAYNELTYTFNNRFNNIYTGSTAEDKMKNVSTEIKLLLYVTNLHIDDDGSLMSYLSNFGPENVDISTEVYTLSPTSSSPNSRTSGAIDVGQVMGRIMDIYSAEKRKADDILKPLLQTSNIPKDIMNIYEQIIREKIFEGDDRKYNNDVIQNGIKAYVNSLYKVRSRIQLVIIIFMATAKKYIYQFTTETMTSEEKLLLNYFKLSNEFDILTQDTSKEDKLGLLISGLLVTPLKKMFDELTPIHGGKNTRRNHKVYKRRNSKKIYRTKHRVTRRIKRRQKHKSRRK